MGLKDTKGSIQIPYEGTACTCDAKEAAQSEVDR